MLNWKSNFFIITLFWTYRSDLNEQVLAEVNEDIGVRIA